MCVLKFNADCTGCGVSVEMKVAVLLDVVYHTRYTATRI